MLDKAVKLKKIAGEIQNCKICKKDKNGKAVPGEGNPDAKIVFIGEAPGRQEAKTGRPFVGRSGKFLRSMIRELGFKDDEVFITSPVKYLPDRGTPTSKDIAHGRVHLIKQLELIDPKTIVLLGSVAIQGVLDQKIPILANHGKILRQAQDDKMYFVTFHPSAALRFPALKKPFVEDFKKLKSVVRSYGLI